MGEGERTGVAQASAEPSLARCRSRHRLRTLADHLWDPLVPGNPRKVACASTQRQPHSHTTDGGKAAARLDQGRPAGQHAHVVKVVGTVVVHQHVLPQCAQ